MKLMIASDIHGSALYCEKLLERFREEKPDRLLLLGDILYHGPRNDLPEGYAPKKVIPLLNEISGYCVGVRGNCDAEVDQMVLDFSIMDDYLYLNIDGLDIYATHGNVYDQHRPMKGTRGILLGGHTHVPAIEEFADYVYLNPGSVSIPKDGTERSYMILENRVFQWKKLEDGETYKEYRVKE